MAYINGINSSASSIYGNRNILTGLASGMDTETMIENAVSGHKMKIEQLVSKRTVIGWQQEGYRSIIEKMSSFLDKYTSFASPTNLMSGGFFNSAIKIKTSGTNADKISATGQTNSDIQILGVKQLASSATLKVSGIGSGGNLPTVLGEALDLSKGTDVSDVAGSIKINYGGQESVRIEFAKDETFKDAQEFVDAINKKLEKENITIGETTYKATDKVKVELDSVSGEIKFSDKNGVNSVYISEASGKIKDTLKIDTEANNKDKKDTVLNTKDVAFSHVEGTVGEKLSEAELSVTFDGVTRKIKLPKFTKDTAANAENTTFSTTEELAAGIKKALAKEFGDGKIDVVTEDGKMKFAANQKGSSLSLGGDAVKLLGFENKTSTYVDSKKTLAQIWGDTIQWDALAVSKAQGEVKLHKGSNGEKDYYVDEKGNRVAQLKEGDSTYYRVDDKGNALYDFKVNGVTVGSFNKDSELSSVMLAINNNSEAGVSASYSETTDQFTFTSKNSGVAGKVEFDGLGKAMFGSAESPLAGTSAKYEAGKDAIVSMKVNGELLDGVTRSDNNFTVDGLSIKLNETFGEYKDDKLASVANAEKEAVAFKAEADSDKVVEAVKSMVEDFNTMATEIKKAFSTLPAQKGNGKFYEPLTDKDKEGMTESAIKEYEEKAKQGLLFADKDLSALYDGIRKAISLEGKDGVDMRAIGLEVAYSGGTTTLRLDEEKLRAAMETDPDKVKNVFTKNTENGASSNGIMTGLKRTLDMYGKVHGGKGILVEKAGSPLAGTTLFNNELQKKIEAFDRQIELWQNKMNDQIDRYSKQFSKMEQLIAQMNSQSASMGGIMGGF